MAEANEFKLEGWGYLVELWFAGGFDGGPHLRINRAGDPDPVDVGEVKAEKTELGKIVSAVIRGAFDGHTEKVSFLVPQVNVTNTSLH